MSPQQKLNFSWGNLNSSLLLTAQQLHHSGELVDVTLSAGGRIFPAHKLVLSAASPLLMELLKNTKCKHPVVMLAGISACDLEAILHFVYHGEVSVDSARLSSLLQAAQCLDIQALTPPIFHDKSQSPTMPTHMTNGEQKYNTMTPYFPTKKHRPKVKVKSDEKIVQDLNSSAEEDSVKLEVNGNDSADKENGSKKPTLVSDLPVSCHLCGATIRQSRNFRRHMELIHMKTEGPPRIPKKKMKKFDQASPTMDTSSPPISLPDKSHEFSESIGIITMATRIVNSPLEDGQGSDSHLCGSKPLVQSQIPHTSTPHSQTTVPSVVSATSQVLSYPCAPLSTGSSTPGVAPLHPIYDYTTGHVLTPVQHIQQLSSHHQQSFRHVNIYHDTREQPS